MVSLVILSLGVLGMASLQLTAIKQNQSAYMRTQANHLAYDVVDRMRINSGETDSYIDQDSGTEDSSCVSYSGAATGCSRSAMAAHDLFEWLSSLGRELPSGSGRLCRGALDLDDPDNPDCDIDADAPVTVYIWWDDERNGSTVQFAVSAEL